MKWLIGIGLTVLLAAGIFFYWADNSETVEETQHEIVENVHRPINDAEEAEKAYSESQTKTSEKVEEITGE